MNENVLDFVGLLYPDTDTDTVYAGFYEDLLVLVTRHSQRVQEDLGRALGLNLWYVVSFGSLRSEV